MAEVNEWMKGVEQRQAADSLEQQLQLQEVRAASSCRGVEQRQAADSLEQQLQLQEVRAASSCRDVASSAL